jgi:hypothetical protein
MIDGSVPPHAFPDPLGNMGSLAVLLSLEAADRLGGSPAMVRVSSSPRSNRHGVVIDTKGAL